MKRRSSKGSPSPGASPALRGKGSIQDLLFDMDEEEEGDLSQVPPLNELESHPTTPKASGGNEWQEVVRKRSVTGDETPISSPPQAAVLRRTEASPRDPGRPWGGSPLPSSKLDMRAIMEQASSSRMSSISLGLSSQSKTSGSGSFKMSQKERKRLQQAAQQQPSTPSPSVETSTAPKSASPWQTLPLKARPVFPSVATDQASSGRASRPPQLTMRQAIANPIAASKDEARTLPSGTQRRAISGPLPATSPTTSTTPVRPHAKATAGPLTPQQPHIQSIRHTPLPRSALTNADGVPYGLKDILDQEQASKDKLKEAVAPRSLQDIQQEQEFQEWWDRESRKVIAEEEAKARAEKRAARNRRGRGKGRAKEREGDAGDTSSALLNAPKAPKRASGR